MSLQSLNWVPIDIASAGLLEMLRGGADEPVLHLSSPRAGKWDDVWGPIAEHLGVPLVAAREWVEKLEASARAAGKSRTGPSADTYQSAHALLPFFTATMLGPLQDPRLGSDKALRVARSLAGLDAPGREDVLRWAAYWDRVGFL